MMTMLISAALAMAGPPPVVMALPSQAAPYERMGARAAKVGRHLMLVGGFDYPDRQCLRCVGLLDSRGQETEAAIRLAVGRNHFELLSLPHGRLLAIGGYSEDYGSLADVECLDFAHGRVEAWPWLKDPAELFSLVELPGRAAIIGGLTAQGDTVTLDDIQVIDLKTREVALNPERLSVSRFGLDAIWLPKLGRVFIAGGKHITRMANGPGKTKAEYSALASVELWDPVSGRVQPAGTMTTPRDRPRLFALPDGKVLIVGGATDTAKLDSIEMFDPTTGTSRVVAHMSVARMAALILPYRNQGLLIAGGWVDDPAGGAKIEFLRFSDMQITVVGHAAACRAEGIMAWVGRDTFLLTGGKDAFNGRNPHEYRFRLTEAFRVK
jgi:hypothetical protein